MTKVAFFVDGHFLFHQVRKFRSFFCDGPNIRDYCERHLKEGEKIYKIFYYDAPPLEREGSTPFGNPFNLGKGTTIQKMQTLFTSIKETPFMVLRLGKVSWQNDWILSASSVHELINGTRTAESLSDADFYPNIQQKGVDMRIGLDISDISFHHSADRIVLVGGDADFVPAVKLARKQGLEVTVDPMGNNLSSDLIEHVDYVHCALDSSNPEDVDPLMAGVFVHNPKEI